VTPTTHASAVKSKHPELVEFIQRAAFKRGSFVLSSGSTSNYYIDGKLVSFDPEGAWLTVEALLSELADVEYDAVGGMDMGATPIVAALALRSFQIGKPIPTFTVRKEAKEHGTKKLIEGPLQRPCRVVIVDDVVTTGESIRKAIEAVRAIGCTVQLAISVVDRRAGADELLQGMGIPYRPLVRLAELGV